MREIKFRQAIFHPVTGELIRWHYWGLIDGAFVGIDTGWYSPAKAIKNSYQYTGLQDKNGVECYWGDWVTDGINPKFLVTPDHHLLARLSEIEFEIVGNKDE